MIAQTAVEQMQKQFEAEASSVADSQALASLRERWLGRERGLISQEMRKLGQIPKDQRPAYGRALNELKAFVEARLHELSEHVRKLELKLRLESEKVDASLPGFPYALGKAHPIQAVRQRIEDIFVRMGFTVIETPEIDDEYHNFEALNMPSGHPARDAMDTFYVSESFLLRTHCTPMQIHFMLKHSPPLRVIASGKVYRRDNPDATHSPVFHQCDGLLVDVGITLADLKGTLEAFAKELFHPDIKVRFRPSYFPFVEPGAEMDISCIFCQGSGCRICKQSGWIEILGSGMVHPKVFEAVGYDPDKYAGFAWGMGIDRIVMLKYGIDDIRLLYENDLRFLSQF